ncbi:glycosyltransferase family A protein [Flavilitoribacter nigricans]|nr:glycosyltransferase family A protein [Flavilitoribacter nigricans]
MQDKILLSILILSIPERHTSFLTRLLRQLEMQALGQPVEILVFTDNRQRTIGEKRNQLVALAKGDYFCFVDDDDRVAPDYVIHILRALHSKPDCVVFDAWVTLNGIRGKICKYGKEYQHRNGAAAYYRRPNHIMVHRRDNVKDIQFLALNFGEDDEWATRVVERVKKQVRIPKILYYYDYSRTTSRSGR